MEEFDLSRYIDAQEGVYGSALAELRKGKKQGHWMWFIFPQIAGLGRSVMSRRYAIASLDEARAYLKHKVLGPRLEECCRAIMELQGKSAREIFGETDEMKLRSSATLFAEASGPGSVFHEILQKYFNGERDSKSLDLLR